MEKESGEEAGRPYTAALSHHLPYSSLPSGGGETIPICSSQDDRQVSERRSARTRLQRLVLRASQILDPIHLFVRSSGVSSSYAPFTLRTRPQTSRLSPVGLSATEVSFWSSIICTTSATDRTTLERGW